MFDNFLYFFVVVCLSKTHFNTSSFTNNFFSFLLFLKTYRLKHWIFCGCWFFNLIAKVGNNF